MRYKSIITTLMMSAACLTAGAQTPDSIPSEPTNKTPHNTVGRKWVEPLITTKIKLLTRTYGDSIVLRWAAEDYVSYKYLCDYGVNVLRVPRNGQGRMKIDTLAYGLKPLSLEE